MQLADSACYILSREFDNLFAIALKADIDPFASCKKVFAYRVQYPFVSQIFSNFVCGALIPFCKLQKGILYLLELKQNGESNPCK
jgi:hypothetical protein